MVRDAKCATRPKLRRSRNGPDGFPARHHAARDLLLRYALIAAKLAGCDMAYTVTSDSLGLAIDAVSETANDVHEALSKARQMYETGLVNVSIKDDNGHTIDGDELFACITGKKTITDDLQAR